MIHNTFLVYPEKICHAEIKKNLFDTLSVENRLLKMLKIDKKKMLNIEKKLTELPEFREYFEFTKAFVILPQFYQLVNLSCASRHPIVNTKKWIKKFNGIQISTNLSKRRNYSLCLALKLIFISENCTETRLISRQKEWFSIKTLSTYIPFILKTWLFENRQRHQFGTGRLPACIAKLLDVERTFKTSRIRVYFAKRYQGHSKKILKIYMI